MIVPAMSATDPIGGADPIIGGNFSSNIPGEAMRPLSASNFDPLWRRVLAVAIAPSELVGVAETARARVVV